MLADLVKKIDVFLERYSKDDPSRKGMKTDLLELVQSAVDHGEQKDQNKISGIIGKVVKSFMSSGKD